MKLEELISGPALEYALSRDPALLKRAESEVQQSNFKESYGKDYSIQNTIILHGWLMKSLKEKDPAYLDMINQEIETKKEKAEINIDYLEDIFPLMRTFNIISGISQQRPAPRQELIGGLYKKIYSADDAEVKAFSSEDCAY